MKLAGIIGNCNVNANQKLLVAVLKRRKQRERKNYLPYPIDAGQASYIPPLCQAWLDQPSSTCTEGEGHDAVHIHSLSGLLKNSILHLTCKKRKAFGIGFGKPAGC